MAVTTQVSVDEYLRTSYDPDCEYVDGEVLDRNVGELDHAWIQRAILLYVAAREKQLGVTIIQEQRLQVNSRQYRVPDLMILLGSKPNEQIISRPPLVCIEVLSPEDRMSRMQKKIVDYLAFGVRYVWILDPKTKQAFSYTSEGMRLIQDGILRTSAPAIEIPLGEIFD
ncbi:MAG TPA: Uma2 family endonuclease [Bryobacteraceae bacterium]|nr:Uma2 family endonuclease [Bryobacteraceae bacterium]